MISECSANNHRARMARVTIPRIGAWLADVWTDDEVPAAELAGRFVFRLGKLSLTGVRIRGEAWQGGTRLRLVGGFGGWRKALPARWYASDAGVKPAQVAQDAALECGETISEGLASNGSLGAWYAREAWSASRTLYQLSAPWRILDDGTTSLRPWPTTRIATPFDVTGYDSDRMIVELATDAPEEWRPGAVFTNRRLPDRSFTVSDVVHTIQPDKYRTQAWCQL